MSTENVTLLDKPTPTMSPIVSVAQGTNNVGGILFGLAQIALGIGQIVYNQVWDVKKNVVFTVTGGCIIGTGLYTIANTIFDFGLWRKQVTHANDLEAQLSAKTGIQQPQPGSFEELTQKCQELETKNLALKKAEIFQADLIDLAEKYPEVSDAIKEAKRKRREEILSSQNSSVTSTPVVVKKHTGQNGTTEPK